MFQALANRLLPCGLRLRVQLTKDGARTLEPAALLGFNDHRELLAHRCVVQCFRGGNQCRCFPAREPDWRRLIPGEVLGQFGPFRPSFIDAGCEYLVDKDGWRPGVYYLDFKAKKLLLVHMRATAYADPDDALRERLVASQNQAASGNQQAADLNHVHASHSPIDGPSVAADTPFLRSTP